MDRLGEFVDLERYPIHDPGGAGRKLVEQCRESLAARAICVLPDFVRPEALVALQREVGGSRGEAYRVDNLRRAYAWRNQSGFSDDHPVAHRSANRLGSITGESLPASGVLVPLFEEVGLTEFVRRCLGLDRLYPVACPYLSVNAKVMGAGDCHAWHFDQNDGVVSLLIQSAREGGDFEYAPYIRGEDDENYAEVARLLAGDPSRRVTVEMSPGSFCLFNGRRSLHRVSEVAGGNPDRLIALFSYHHASGHLYPEDTLRAVLGRLPDSFEISI